MSQIGKVMRLGGERVCAVFNRNGLVSEFVALGGRKNSSLEAEDGDDATNDMGLYKKGGAICTCCGQLALFDLQSDELTVDCLACIANLGARGC